MFDSVHRRTIDSGTILDKESIVQLARANDRIGLSRRQVLEHCARTAVTAVASLLVARLFGLPETYWAAVTTLVITQSSLGTTLAVSWQRFIGTVLGAIVGAILASYLAPNALVFGVSVFLLGLLCAVLQTDRSAYRFGAVTLAIVMLVPQMEPAWRMAIHRSAEVSIGIVVALLMTVVLPEVEGRIKEPQLVDANAPAKTGGGRATTSDGSAPQPSQAVRRIVQR
jgi:uncharacterized membrane protein YgaE (UPF0421/DUF939 family)